MNPLSGQRSCNAVATANKFPESNAAIAGTLPYLATVAAVAYPLRDRDQWRVSKLLQPLSRVRRAYDVKTTMFPGILRKPFCPVLFDVLDRP
jgi:hypothetical protein